MRLATSSKRTNTKASSKNFNAGRENMSLKRCPECEGEVSKRATRCAAIGVNRHFQFKKRCQRFIGVHNETLSVVAERVGNKNCSDFSFSKRTLGLA
jgi:hypothetical protein